MSKAHLGKTLSKESIDKRTAKVLGSKRSQKTIDKMRSAQKTVSVTQLEKDGTPVKEWSSISEAARSLGISQSHITSCCKGKKKTIGGFRWEYKLNK